MAKSKKNAGLICAIVSILAALGVALGIWKASPIAVVILMLPAVIYEVYRTEGFYTKAASVGMLVVLSVLIAMIAGKLSLNLAHFLAEYGITMAVDVRLTGPAIIAILAVILFRRTAGIYTRWLAVVIILASAGLFYVMDPTLFTFLLERGAAEGAKRIQ
jgi:hypothetical protein